MTEDVDVTARVTKSERDRLRVLAKLTGIPFAKMAGAAIRAGLDAVEGKR